MTGDYQKLFILNKLDWANISVQTWSDGNGSTRTNSDITDKVFDATR